MLYLYVVLIYVECIYIHNYTYSARVYQFSLSLSRHSKGLAFAAPAHSRSRRKLPINLENLEATGRSHAQWRSHLPLHGSSHKNGRAFTKRNAVRPKIEGQLFGDGRGKTRRQPRWILFVHTGAEGTARIKAD